MAVANTTGSATALAAGVPDTVKVMAPAASVESVENETVPNPDTGDGMVGTAAWDVDRTEAPTWPWSLMSCDSESQTPRATVILL